MWKVKSASSSLGSLSVKGCIHHHFEQMPGYCKARTPKWEIFRVKYFCIYSGIRSIEQAFRVTVLTDMRRDYWFSSSKCSCINNSNKFLKLFSSFYFNFWLIINYWFILCINNKKEFLNVQVNEKRIVYFLCWYSPAQESSYLWSPTTYLHWLTLYIYTYASFGQYILQRYTLLLLQTSLRDPDYCI